jgi:hypothetical protein
MTAKLLKTLTLGSMLAINLAVTGCAKEVEHHESSEPRLLGGRKHEETTVKENPDGTRTTEKEVTKTR